MTVEALAEEPLRRRLRQLAQQHRAGFLEIECACSDERDTAADSLSVPTFGRLVSQLAANYAAPERCVTVDTARPCGKPPPRSSTTSTLGAAACADNAPHPDHRSPRAAALVPNRRSGSRTETAQSAAMQKSAGQLPDCWNMRLADALARSDPRITFRGLSGAPTANSNVAA